jgi:hypothetical protein
MLQSFAAKKHKAHFAGGIWVKFSYRSNPKSFTILQYCTLQKCHPFFPDVKSDFLFKYFKISLLYITLYKRFIP